MPDPSPALVKPLLEEEIPRRACCNWKFFSLFFLLIGSCLAVELSLKPSPHKDLDIDMQTLSFHSRQQLLPHGSKHHLLPLGSKQQALPLASRRQSFGRASPISGQERSPIVARATEVFEVPPQFRVVKPLGDTVLVKVDRSEVKTKGGILLEDKIESKGGVEGGPITALGSSFNNTKLKLGDLVFCTEDAANRLPDVLYNQQNYLLIKTNEIIGSLPAGTSYDQDLFPKMQPMGDRVVCKVIEKATTTKTGIIMDAESEFAPSTAIVEKVGHGTENPEKPGEFTPLPFKEGDKIIYIKYAGVPITTKDGTKYISLRAPEILMKIA